MINRKGRLIMLYEKKISNRDRHLRKVNREWLTIHGFSPLEDVRKRIEGEHYPVSFGQKKDMDVKDR